jgi:peptide/nickel transport system substrate-binding protein
VPAITALKSTTSLPAVNKAAQIATGPFQFAEWDGATVVNMRRFKDYKPNVAYAGRDGYSGKRTAWFDEVSFKVVTEASARVAGLQTGQFHIVDDIPRRRQAAAPDSKLRVFDHPEAGINDHHHRLRPPTDNLLGRGRFSWCWTRRDNVGRYGRAVPVEPVLRLCRE